MNKRKINYKKMTAIFIMATILTFCISFPGFSQFVFNATPLDVDVTDEVGRSTSLAIVDGNPAVAYFDETNLNLEFVRASDISGSTWNSPVTVDNSGNVSGSFISLVVVDGNPAIAYRDNADGIQYVRATDATGSSWGTPVDIDGSISGGSPSMEIVNGNPAVAFNDITNSDLEFVRANDATGATWGAVVTVTSTNSVGQAPSLAIVNGRPAIAFYDSTNGDLLYVRASNINGSGWNAVRTVDSSDDAGRAKNSLEVIDGRPAIAYLDDFGGKNYLSYVRATGINGATWGTPVLLDSMSNALPFPSLEIINSVPAISYCYFPTDVLESPELRYIVSSDASGTSWESALTVDNSSDCGRYSSLLLVDGSPAISYQDFTDKDLRYVRGMVILSLGILNFEAHIKDNNEANLTWEVASHDQEWNFIIERSKNGSHFEQIDSIVTSINDRQYSFVDPNPLSGANYYRIRQIGTNGQHKYSNVVSLFKKATQQKISVYPNPFSSELNLQGDIEDLTAIRLWNYSGQLKIESIFPKRVNFYWQALEAGLYILECEFSNNEKSFHSIIKTD